MAIRALNLLVFMYLFGSLYGELLSSNLYKRDEPTHKIKSFLDFETLYNDIESNDIPLNYGYPKTEAAMDFSTSKQHHEYKIFNVGEDDVIIQLPEFNVPSSNLISEYSGIERKNPHEQSEYVAMNIITEKQTKNIGGSGTFRKEEGVQKSYENELTSSMLDEMVDFLLQIVRDEIHKTGRDQIVIPDVDEQFSTRIAFF
ncbi:hypothetical protein L9F63_002906 [Diploptera punctata]|uniref:Uncharacterized protein n=1 Tax=Diploptera punctata TaxID=6984 RepID=A0AAD7ZRH4_DIPPU|nr:hypothetical protein L9F63_002906 [Diploptera punctata]